MKDIICTFNSFKDELENVIYNLKKVLYDGEILNEEDYKKRVELISNDMIDRALAEIHYDIVKEYVEDQQFTDFIKIEELAKMTINEAIEAVCKEIVQDKITVTVQEIIEAENEDYGIEDFSMEKFFSSFVECGECQTVFNTLYNEYISKDDNQEGRDVCPHCIGSYRQCSECEEYFIPNGRERKCNNCR